MRIPQLKFTPLGPELEIVLLNQSDFEANLLHGVTPADVPAGAILPARPCNFVQDWI